MVALEILLIGLTNYLWTGGILMALVLYVYYVNFIHAEFKALRKMIYGKGRVVLFKGGHTYHIQEMADQRKKRIREFLDNTDRGNTLFYERPPGQEYQDFFIGQSDAPPYGHLSSLYQQLGSMELLLAERLIDALIAIYRRQVSNIRDQYLNFPTVKIESTRKKQVADPYFPWTVVIETNQKKFWQEALESLEDWIAVRVEIADAFSVVPLQGQCRMADGLTGVAGGMVAMQGGRYAMTCAHVLSKNCGSEIFQTNLHTNDSPDVALLREGSPCFTDIVAPYFPLPHLSSLETTSLLEVNGIARKLLPGKRFPKGIVHARVRDFTVGGVFYRFPHVQVVPRLIRQFGLIFPLFHRQFSVPGESGTWVVDDRSGRFIGMVVAGNGYCSISYLIEAEPLVDYLKRALNDAQLSLNQIQQ